MKNLIFGYGTIDDFRLDGGKGSGNFGHSGRPGQVGGSGDGGTLSSTANPSNLSQLKSDLKSLKAAYKSPNCPNKKQALADVLAKGKEIDDAVIKQFQDNVDNCQTTKDVEDFMRAKHFMQQSRTGTQLVKLDGMDVEMAKRVYRTYESICNRFPKLQGKLAGIEPDASMASNTYANCNTVTGVVHFNQKTFSNRNAMKQQYKHDVMAGFHPKGTDYKSVITHEIGHNIDQVLSRKMGSMYGQLEASKQMMKGVRNAMNMSTTDVQNSVSGYATQNKLECFAEAFAEGMNSRHPRTAATEYMKQLDKLINQYL